MKLGPRILCSLILAYGIGATASDAQEVGARGPVVIELYTSQGCSSCPPADEMLTYLTKREDVIPLALHVDYWDYIGWKDSFAQPRFTKRQKAYARAAGTRTIYTPQAVVGGLDHVVGNRPMEVSDQINRHAALPAVLSLSAERAGDSLRIEVGPAAPGSGEMVIQLVRYKPKETVEILRGENAGKTITYHNIVTEWTRVADWSGTEAMALDVSAPGELPAVVIVQSVGAGPILAAAVVR